MLGSDRMGDLFGMGMVVLGLGLAAWHAEDAYTGWRLTREGVPVAARVTGKTIDVIGTGRPATSVTVNDTTVESLRAFLSRDHFLVVAYPGEAGRVEARAAVSRESYRTHAVGDRVSARILPHAPAVADVENGGLMRHGLKRAGVGLAMMLVGALVCCLPARRDDEHDQDALRDHRD